MKDELLLVLFDPRQFQDFECGREVKIAGSHTIGAVDFVFGPKVLNQNIQGARGLAEHLIELHAHGFLLLNEPTVLEDGLLGFLNGIVQMRQGLYFVVFQFLPDFVKLIQIIIQGNLRLSGHFAVTGIDLVDQEPIGHGANGKGQAHRQK